MARIDSKLLTSPELGKQVLKLLGLLAPLPVQGFIAGQAVASAVDACLGTGVCVINDIDIFMGPREWSAQTGDLRTIRRSPKMIGGFVQFTGAPIQARVEAAEYAGLHGVDPISERPLYTVETARVDGLLNRVLVSFNRGQPVYGCEATTPKFALDLISGFDLNNVQIAVSAESGKLYYTPAFVDYFSGRELRITASVTPVQTYLRYLRKRRDLGSFGNDLAQKELVVQLLNRNRGSDAWEARRLLRFKEGKLVMADTAPLRKNLGEEESAAATVGQGTAKATLTLGPKYREVYEEFHSEMNSIVQLSKHGKREVWLATLTPETLASSAEKLEERLPRTGFHQVPRYWEMVNMPSRMTVTRRALYRMFLAQVDDATAARYRESYAVLGDTYLVGIEDVKPMAEILDLVQKHPEVIPVLSGLSFHDQVVLIRRSRDYMRQYDLSEVWGVFRTLRRDAGPALLLQPELLHNEFSLFMDSKVPLVSAKLPLPEMVGNVTVTELTTVSELIDEGTRMSHCVGGYGKAILNCTSRILSLIAGPGDGDSSTVEWCWGTSGRNPRLDLVLEPLTVQLRQIRAYDNQSASKLLCNVETELRQRVNRWLEKNVDEGWKLLSPVLYQQHIERVAAREALAA